MNQTYATLDHGYLDYEILLNFISKSIEGTIIAYYIGHNWFLRNTMILFIAKCKNLCGTEIIIMLMILLFYLTIEYSMFNIFIVTAFV